VIIRFYLHLVLLIIFNINFAKCMVLADVDNPEWHKANNTTKINNSYTNVE
jgi:hypothetical protein